MGVLLEVLSRSGTLSHPCFRVHAGCWVEKRLQGESEWTRGPGGGGCTCHGGHGGLFPPTGPGWWAHGMSAKAGKMTKPGPCP